MIDVGVGHDAVWTVLAYQLGSVLPLPNNVPGWMRCIKNLC